MQELFATLDKVTYLETSPLRQFEHELKSARGSEVDASPVQLICVEAVVGGPRL